MNDVDELLAKHAARWQETAALPEARLPERRPRRVAALAAAASVAVLAMGAAALVVTRDADRPSAPAAVLPRGGAEAPVAATALDRYDAATAAFLSRFAAGGAGSEAERFASLREAYLSATAVVVGEIGDVRATRTVNGVTYTGIVLDRVEVLRGALRDPGAEVVVEFLGDAGAVRAAAPSGYGIWLLRNKADVAPGVTPKPGAPAADESAYYRLVSSQGLFVQGETHVVNPVRERVTPEPGAPSPAPEIVPRDPVAREAEAFARLSALVAHLRLMA